MMYSYLLSGLLCLYGNKPEKVSQANNAIRISGSCRDNSTKNYLKKSTVYTGFKSGKRQIGTSDDTGNFDLRIPDSTQYLSFEVEGYHTFNMPVNFIGKIASSSNFPLFVEMSQKDSLPLALPDYLFVCLVVPDSVEVDYKLMYPKAPQFSATSYRKNFNNGKHWPFLVYSCPQPGKYVLTALAPGGPLYLKKEMILAPGFNFTDLHIHKPKEIPEVMPQSEALNEIVVKSLKKRFLYFDQSSYELRKETKVELDQVALFLVNEPNMAAHVTGFTDHVGDKNKNLTLSEFRAKTVMNYLTRKGVRTEQMIVLWKGADSEDAANDSEESKIKKRRVEIQIMPK